MVDKAEMNTIRDGVERKEQNAELIEQELSQLSKV